MSTQRIWNEDNEENEEIDVNGDNDDIDDNEDNEDNDGNEDNEDNDGNEDNDEWGRQTMQQTIKDKRE